MTVEYLLVAQVDMLPESANRIWRVGHGHQYKAKKARDWQLQAAEIFRQHRKEPEPYEGEVFYQVDVYFKGNNTQDLDNRLKQIGDALIVKPKRSKESEKMFAGIIKDDSQVINIYPEKRLAAKGEKAHINVTVWKRDAEGKKICEQIRKLLDSARRTEE